MCNDFIVNGVVGIGKFGSRGSKSAIKTTNDTFVRNVFIFVIVVIVVVVFWLKLMILLKGLYFVYIFCMEVVLFFYLSYAAFSVGRV